MSSIFSFCDPFSNLKFYPNILAVDSQNLYKFFCFFIIGKYHIIHEQ